MSKLLDKLLSNEFDVLASLLAFGDRFFLYMYRVLDRIDARMTHDRLPDLVDCMTHVYSNR